MIIYDEVAISITNIHANTDPLKNKRYINQKANYTIQKANDSILDAY